jgi:hypothetical protein
VIGTGISDTSNRKPPPGRKNAAIATPRPAAIGRVDELADPQADESLYTLADARQLARAGARDVFSI